MRYAKIDKCEYTNGLGIGMSLFVQGCSKYCKNCFNPETWDYNGGYVWDSQTEQKFLRLIDRSYISRFTLVGGEPLDQSYGISLLSQSVKSRRPDIKIWIYSGYTFEQIIQSREKTKPLLFADVLVDGRYIDELKDLALQFRGSSNQRILDVQKSLEVGVAIPYEL